uniref:Uncharacterized protein n=1 Tax=Plectus sambesii TaxID=2011161 RepID=A0A914VTE0_9BILA
MARFDEKVVIITGASSGIGQATAVLFAKRGASIAITGRSEKNLQATRDLAIKAGGTDDKILLIVADVTKEEDTKRIIDETVKKFGQLDVLVNNAGGGTLEGFNDSHFNQPLKVYDYVNNLNMRSVIALCQEAIPHLKKTKGNIVNVSSIGSSRPMPGYTYYQVAKASLDHLNRCLAVALGPEGVRVNNVNPGIIRTNFNQAMGVPDETVKKLEDAWVKPNVPLRRPGEPIEIATTIAFLASDEASYITGQMIIADGGTCINTPPLPSEQL